MNFIPFNKTYELLKPVGVNSKTPVLLFERLAKAQCCDRQQDEREDRQGSDLWDQEFHARAFDDDGAHDDQEVGEG